VADRPQRCAHRADRLGTAAAGTEGHPAAVRAAVPAAAGGVGGADGPGSAGRTGGLPGDGVVVATGPVADACQGPGLRCEGVGLRRDVPGGAGAGPSSAWCPNRRVR
jgi:hypothetical protein